MGEATHGQDAFEDDFSFGMRRGGEGGPEGGDGRSFGHGEGVEGLAERSEAVGEREREERTDEHNQLSRTSQHPLNRNLNETPISPAEASH